MVVKSDENLSIDVVSRSLGVRKSMIDALIGRGIILGDQVIIKELDGMIHAKSTAAPNCNTQLLSFR